MTQNSNFNLFCLGTFCLIKIYMRAPKVRQIMLAVLCMDGVVGEGTKEKGLRPVRSGLSYTVRPTPTGLAGSAHVLLKNHRPL